MKISSPMIDGTDSGVFLGKYLDLIMLLDVIVLGFIL